MPSIEDGITLAVEAHRGQKDKAKAAYFLHPLRLRMKNDADRIVAVLHDVLEDSDVTVRTFRRSDILRKSYKRLHPYQVERRRIRPVHRTGKGGHPGCQNK